MKMYHNYWTSSCIDCQSQISKIKDYFLIKYFTVKNLKISLGPSNKVLGLMKNTQEFKKHGFEPTGNGNREIITLQF